MTCETFEELAGAYALDAVSDEERSAIEAHLTQCPHCKKIIQELQSIVELLPLAAPAHEPSKNLKGRLLAAIETEVEPRPMTVHPRQESQPRKIRRLSWPTSLIAAAAICLLALSSGLTAWNIELQQQVTQLTARALSLSGDVPAAIRHRVVPYGVGSQRLFIIAQLIIYAPPIAAIGAIGGA